MRKAFLIFLIIMSLCSCTLDSDTRTGMVSFSDQPKSLTASVTYPETTDKTWTITARKIDGGADIGSGTIEGALLTDTFGPFSVGIWEFTLDGYDANGRKVFTGTTEATVKVGNNPVSVTLHTTADGGTLSFEGSNFSKSEKGAVTKVILIIDNEDAKSWNSIQMTTEDNDLFFLPTFTKTMTKGIHAMHLRWLFESGDIAEDPDILFRIDNGAVTHITIGLTEGSLMFDVSVDTIQPIAVQEP